MRDINGLGTMVAAINGIIYKKQIMVTDETTDINFVDEIFIDQLFKTEQYMSPNTKCMVQIGLQYAWPDSDICPDFTIVIMSGNKTLVSSKQGLDDYPGQINTAQVSFIMLDSSTIRVKLTKTMTDVTRFRLYVHSFIKIDAI